jgi:ABC-type sugar transport system ATPase subunit
MPYLELKHISKSFGAVKALTDINLSIDEGTIHAMVGENGAGKSTLGKIVTGVLHFDEGNIALDGRAVRFGSPRDAMIHGIAGIQQEVTLVPHMTVLENVFLGIEETRNGLLLTKKLKRDYAELCNDSGFNLPTDVSVASLSTADKKKVELLRALARNAKLIVFDELTASLGPDDSKKLISIIRNLRDKGTTIIYISHFLEEVLGLADEVTVLRNGGLVKTSSVSQETKNTLISSMVGQEIDLEFPPKSIPSSNSREVLSVSGLSRKGVFDDISLTIREGEIVGLAGLVGSGRTEIARAIYGANPFDSGEIKFLDRSVRIKSPNDAIRAGIMLLPENRKIQGLVMQFSVGQNVTLPHLDSISKSSVINIKQEFKQTCAILNKFDVRPPVPQKSIRYLSGGNQQKVMFAKGLFNPPYLLIADEPTCGVDVNARRAIYSIITSLVKEGMAVMLISSEAEEIVGLAHRAYVLSNGRITSVLEGEEITVESIIKAEFNMKEDIGSRNQI